MNKRGLIIFSLSIALVVFLSCFVVAANDTADKAYKCLESQITERGNLSLKEATFSALALGSKGNLVSRIEADRDTAKSCWPKNACTLKETAQVALAYNRISKDTSAIKGWILSKNASAPDLKWFLEIDITNKVPANCVIKDGTRENKIKILDNMKIQGSPGSCFTIDANGFMLRISNNCLKNEFEISCDQDFITSTLYQKNAGGTIFVPPETHSAASLGATKESVNGECLKTGAGCDYEGTLWAALALQKMGEDNSRFLPYLLALADDNTRFFPSTFLYILAGGDDQYNLIIQEQKQGKYWEVAGTRDGRYYDTSLAMMALNGKEAAELDNAKAYLASIQTKEGCWNSNNIRDSAFILYSGWTKSVPSVGEVSSPPDCEPQFSCENIFDCEHAGGIIESNYACLEIGKSCCSIAVAQQTCSQMNGILCGTEKVCQGGRVEDSAEGSCCFGSCVAIAKDLCTPAGGTCLASCGESEQESTELSCSNAGEKCCVAKAGSSLWIWIVILIILIALVALAIIYRDKVKVLWFRLKEKLKEKFGKKKAAAAPQAGARPGAPFMPFARPMLPQPRMMPPQTRPVVPIRAPIRPVARDKEMEEALRKLREMSRK